MTDPSAVRPLLLPADPFTEEDIETLAYALEDFYGGSWRDEAGFVLRHLATAGRLLPPSAEHREEEEEFMVEGALPDGTPWVSDPHYRLGDARQLAAMLAPGAVIKRRMISAGPWVEVDGSTDA